MQCYPIKYYLHECLFLSLHLWYEKSFSFPFLFSCLDYKSLGILKRQFPNTPLIGLTATATNHVLKDAQNILHVQKCITFTASFNRPNLYYEVGLVTWFFGCSAVVLSPGRQALSDCFNLLENMSHDGKKVTNYCVVLYFHFGQRFVCCSSWGKLAGLLWSLFFNGLLSCNLIVHKENIVFFFKWQNSCVYYTGKSKKRLFGRLFAHLNSDMCIIYFWGSA